MAISLYDVSVGSYLQTLTAVSGFLAKSREHFEKNGVSLKEILETRLYPDMFPFTFQVIATAHHALGTVRALESGEFGPPSVPSEVDYAVLERMVKEAEAGVRACTREAVDAAENREISFKLGKMVMPFVARDFVLTFSLPNFHFHAATAYDILRMKGAPLGKRDFLGAMKLKG